MENSDGRSAVDLVLGTAVGGVVLVGLLSFGAVGTAERTWLAIAMTLALAVPMGLDLRADVRGLQALIPMGLALVFGLQVLPAETLAWVAPGRLLPDGAVSGTLATRTDLVSDALCGLVLVMGAWTLVSAARERWTLRAAQSTFAWGAFAFAALGLAHAMTGTGALLGLWEPRQPDGRFWAPLVNPNHHGVVLVLLWPVVLSEARRIGGVASLPLWATVLWTWVFPVVVASMGLVLALGVQFLALLAVVVHGPRRWAGLGAAAVGALVSVWAVGQQQAEWWALSGSLRLQQWSDGLAMLESFPVAGVGGGAYALAYPPFRTVRQFAVYDHAHSDPLQWLVETGAVGALALLLFLWWAPRGHMRGVEAPWGLGLLGLLVHTWVDFPLRVPGVLLLAVVVWALWSGGGVRRFGRVGIVGMLMLQVLTAWWWNRRSIEDRVANRVLGNLATAEERVWLQEHAPWRGEADVAQLNTLKGGALRKHGREALGRHPNDAALTRIVAVRAHEAGFTALADDAMAVSLRADPQDFRSWWVRSSWREADGDAMGAAEDRLEAFRRWPRERLVDPRTFDRAYELFPISVWWLEELSDAPAHWSVRLAWRMLADKDYEVALLASEQAGRLRPAAHARMPARAEALAGLGRVDQAITWTRDWVTEEPDSLWGWVTLAKLGAQTGRPELIGEGGARALLLDPDEPKVRRVLRKLVATLPVCPAPRCVPGGPLWELLEAVEARQKDGPACQDAIRRASHDGDWSRRLATRGWVCE